MSFVDDKEADQLLNGPKGPKRRGPKRRPLSKKDLEPEQTLTTPSLVLTSENFEEEEEREIIFAPNPGPQTQFLAASEQEVLYGGAAGGGKSFGILADAARDLSHPNFQGLIVRKTTEELRELITMSTELYPKIYPGINWRERGMTWKHPRGGTLWMSFLERDADVSRYQGQSFNYVAFDELTQWATPYCWEYLRSRLRTKAPDLKLYMRATSNPGGVGHLWVKRMFIDPAPWGKSFWATDIETGEVLKWPKSHSKGGQPLFKRRFIPAKLSDNPYIYDDGRYEANLLSLPEHQRKQLLDGNWDVVVGAAFPEWNRWVHVIEPFEIPYEWTKFRACDYGYGSHAAVLWFAVTPNDQLIVYRELYVKKVLAADLADMILEAEADDGRINYGVLDSSMWSKKGDAGPSLAEQMIARGCFWRPSDRSPGSRLAGKNEIHRRLQVDEYTGEPRMLFFNTCVNSIAQFPVLPLDPNNPEDVDTKSEDHIYDACRYGVMTRPRSHVIVYSPNFQRGYKPADVTFGY